MDEPFKYRAWKWVVQQVSDLRPNGDQHIRINKFNPDVLVVMDACRADVLNSCIPWVFDVCRSPASSTGEWLSVAEKTGIFESSSIASANTQYHKFDDDLGEKEIHNLWETKWNDRLGTVLPEPVLDCADDLLQDGSSQVVAHLLQPHAPYVAKLGDEWVDLLPNTDVWKGTRDENRLSPQVAMAGGYVDTKRAARVYHASVETTWNVVEEYAGKWVSDGHSVLITSDHGETFGRVKDYGFYAHPHGCHVKPLTEVPFIIFEPAAKPEKVAKTAEEKLQALGYKE